MPLTLVTPPDAEPLLLESVKQHLRIDADSTVEDALLEVLIGAARTWVENVTNRVLLTQTWRQTLDHFPLGDGWPLRRCVRDWGGVHRSLRTYDDAIRLGLSPVQSVSSVKYIDDDGTTVTLAADQYVVDVAALPARIHLAYGTSWPSTRCQPNAVIVELVAGYGDELLAVPAPIRAAMLLAIGDLYANRERQIVGTIVAENPTAAALLAPYRVLEAV